MAHNVIDLRKGRPAPRRESPQRRPERADRRSPLRSRRRRARLIAVFAVLVVIAAAVYGAHALSYMTRLNIQSVRVTGVQAIPGDVVSSFVESVLDDGSYHFFSRTNIFLYPKKVLADAVARNFPRIRSAALTRGAFLSTELTVAVEERQPYARWCSERPVLFEAPQRTCFFMDEHGFVFAPADASGEQPSNSYVFSGGIGNAADPVGSVFAPGHLPGIASLLKILGNAGFMPLGASIENERDFYVQLQRGFFIKASYGQDAAQLVRNFELILASDTLSGKEDEVEYVDLRFGNRVYYKLKGQAEIRV